MRTTHCPRLLTCFSNDAPHALPMTIVGINNVQYSRVVKLLDQCPSHTLPQLLLAQFLWACRLQSLHTVSACRGVSCPGAWGRELEIKQHIEGEFSTFVYRSEITITPCLLASWYRRFSQIFSHMNLTKVTHVVYRQQFLWLLDITSMKKKFYTRLNGQNKCSLHPLFLCATF